MTNPELEAEIKKLIVDALMLEDVSPDDIDSTAPLFIEGLGLDSIDALELAVAIDERFAVEISAEDADARDIFASVCSLAAHVAANRPPALRGGSPLA